MFSREPNANWLSLDVVVYEGPSHSKAVERKDKVATVSIDTSEISMSYWEMRSDSIQLPRFTIYQHDPNGVHKAMALDGLV